MNALLQTLAGSELFMDYAKKLWTHISVNLTDNDSIIVFRLLDILIEMNKGCSDVNPSDLHSLMCSEF